MGSCLSCFENTEELENVSFERGYNRKYMTQIDDLLEKKEKDILYKRKMVRFNDADADKDTDSDDGVY
jgi:hypothetical protein